MVRNLFIIAAATMALYSCSTVSHSVASHEVDTYISSVTVANLKVDTAKISKTVEWSWSPFRSSAVSEAKTNATGELLIEQDADVLVEPQFIVKRRGIFRGGSVTVTGYPATYYNFRPMTKEDAEIIAAANGTFSREMPVVVESSSFHYGTARNGSSSAKPLIFNKKDKPLGGTFLSIVGGPTKCGSDRIDTGVNIGLMFGHYGKSWGYYLKASWLEAEALKGDENKKNTGTITVGAIKTLGRNNNLFFGAGIGGNIVEVTNNKGHACADKETAIPLELGWQWHAKHFNVIVGVTGGISVEGGGDRQLSPFVGIGYNF